jgi:hypothetical protein
MVDSLSEKPIIEDCQKRITAKKFEGPKRIIGIHKSKDKPCNGQRKWTK